MNMRTTPDLIKEVLKKSGELTDGTSGYAGDALGYLNSVYRSILSGGSEFGIDIDDPWAWALAPRPLVLTLKPPYDDVAALTLDSFTGVFASIPTISMRGRVLRVGDQHELYVIRSHDAGSTTFMLDQPFAGYTGTYTVRAMQLDYDLVDDTIIIDDSNRYIDFMEGSSKIQAVLSRGVYTPIGFAAHVSTQMMTAGHLIYNHQWNSLTRTFSWKGSANFQLLFSTGAAAAASPSKIMGLDIYDYSGAAQYDSVYSLNAINRIVGPMQIYRKYGFVNTNSPDHGKIYEIDYNTFIREEPLSKLSRKDPDRYCVVRHDQNGIITVRFNAYVDESTRVEVPYIPIHQDLTDSNLSVPLVPLGYRDMLVHGATFYVMSDKSDDKASGEANLAKAKLMALQNHNRRQLHSTSINYARVIPRGR